MAGGQRIKREGSVRYIVGVDLGGSNIVVGTVREDGGEIIGRSLRPTPANEGPDSVVATINEMISGSIAETRDRKGGTVELAGVGIGSPGPVDIKSGTVLLSPNLGWRNFPLLDRIADATDLPTTLDNDANCAVLGEVWLGAARNANIVIGVTVGTGIGGAVVIDGKPFRGASDVAGEFGHMTIDSTGRRCKCGNYGCLEAYASGPAIASRAIESIRAGERSAVADYVDGDLSLITAETVYRAAGDGDILAVEVVRDTARFLGAGLANLLNAFNPDLVLVCGGVTKAGDRLFVPLRNEIKKRAFSPAVEACEIVPGELPELAGVYGAVASFRIQRGESL